MQPSCVVNELKIVLQFFLILTTACNVFFKHAIKKLQWFSLFSPLYTGVDAQLSQCSDKLTVCFYRSISKRFELQRKRVTPQTCAVTGLDVVMISS